MRVKLRYEARHGTVADSKPATDEEGEKVRTEAVEDTEQSQELDQILSSVNHAELKQRLKRLFMKSIEKGNSGRG